MEEQMELARNLVRKFDWTADAVAPGRYIVKGGSWDDKGCGICRPTAYHSRPADIKHILIGFRLVRD
jgi:formylglycine-generating enzyme required for sulfatase activity